ncbi:MAG: DUF4974 domain-containing protein [Puia sp.]|nr:DUF4974 domain-containing protein [Puia sp.]
MSEKTDRIRNLILRDLDGKLSEEESLELQEWIAQSGTNARWYGEITDEEATLEDMMILARASLRKEANRSRALDMEEQTPVKLRWLPRKPLRIAASFAIAASLACLGWLFRHQFSPGKSAITHISASHSTDLPAGGNKAVLTLANGSRIVLDSANNGSLARQGTVQVIKLDSGQIAYRGSNGIPGDLPAEATNAETLYNSISTPRGGQYKIVLPDGSKVWLNSATTLRYPIAFVPGSRTVELTGGEAYFEIARRAGQPFTVKVAPFKPGRAALAVEVLGTNFDINNYDDEPAIRTTLLSGSVRLDNGVQSVLLHPGQQAQANDNSKLITVNTSVDAAGEVAWKDGLFSFDRVGIEAVMRQLARWYDVEISYEGKIPARQFAGTIPRNAPASDVLKILELNKVHFTIEGKKIIVKP